MKGAFEILIADAQVMFHSHFALPTTDEGYIDDIVEHLDMIGANCHDGDKDVSKLINLASAAAAIQRYAIDLSSRMPASEIEQVVMECLP